MPADGPLVLRPGLLDPLRARHASRSRLVAEPGVLTVVRGRRSRRLDVTGCSLVRAQAPSERVLARPLAVVHHDGTVVASLALDEWLCVDLAGVDPRPGGEWLDEVGAALADSLGVPVGSAHRQVAMAAELTPDDPGARRAHVATLLGLAALVAVGVVVSRSSGTGVLAVLGGSAAVALVVLGLTPSRWWLRPAGDDELLVVTADGRAGRLPVGAAVNAADRAVVSDDLVQLRHRRAPAATVRVDQRDRARVAALLPTEDRAVAPPALAPVADDRAAPGLLAIMLLVAASLVAPVSTAGAALHAVAAVLSAALALAVRVGRLRSGGRGVLR